MTWPEHLDVRDVMLLAGVGAVLLVLALQLVLVLRRGPRAATERLEAALGERLAALERSGERTDRAVREELERIRATVDERLRATLEHRLGESFRHVSERLEQVHQGLGEMRTLAAGVGDLKRVLGNVKARGGWGEVQLGALLEEMLAPGQWERNVRPREGSGEVVEYAVRLPGRGDGDPVWLPLDAKFPLEDWQRLVDAHERADAASAETAGKALAARLRQCARDVRAKYLAPPRTTDFAILFLPVEGLFAEVARRPDLVDELQREHRVVLAGPTTLAALLTSLQLGFRTLAIEQRSSEVWKLLGAVKADFGRFAEALDGVQRRLAQAQGDIEGATKRSRAIERRLREVEGVAGIEAGPAVRDPEGELET
jgi:DNA recombination protein RmuC